jgi:hypothetical protein
MIIGAGIGESIDVKIGFVVIDSPDVIGLVDHRGCRGGDPFGLASEATLHSGDPISPRFTFAPLRLCVRFSWVLLGYFVSWRIGSRRRWIWSTNQL